MSQLNQGRELFSTDCNSAKSICSPPPPPCNERTTSDQPASERSNHGVRLPPRSGGMIDGRRSWPQRDCLPFSLLFSGERCTKRSLGRLDAQAALRQYLRPASMQDASRYKNNPKTTRDTGGFGYRRPGEDAIRTENGEPLRNNNNNYLRIMLMCKA